MGKNRTRKKGREGSVTEMLVSRTPMGMAGGGKDTGLSPNIQLSHTKLGSNVFVLFSFCVPKIINSLALGLLLLDLIKKV